MGSVSNEAYNAKKKILAADSANDVLVLLWNEADMKCATIPSPLLSPFSLHYFSSLLSFSY